MSRNAISANPEHYLFKIFQGNMPPDPLEDPKNFFHQCDSKKFFRINFPPPPPKQKNPTQNPDLPKFKSNVYLYLQGLSYRVFSVPGEKIGFPTVAPFLIDSITSTLFLWLDIT